jgi:hypothetical protein
MSVSVFAITHVEVRGHFFPSLAAFGSGTKPTSAYVAQMIDAAAARLAGSLKAEGVTASTISADLGATYPNAYALCQGVIRMDAAIRVMEAVAGAGAVPTFWRAEVDDFYKRLDERGYVALADAPAPSQQSDGPRWHGGRADLDLGDDSDLADLVPKFRRDDEM